MTIPPISSKNPSNLPCNMCRSRPLSVSSTIAFMFRLGAIYGGTRGAAAYWDRTNPKQRNFTKLCKVAFTEAIIGGVEAASIPWLAIRYALLCLSDSSKDLEKTSQEDTDTPPK